MLDLAEQLRQDIRDFKKSSGASRLITIWCASTETFIKPRAIHQSVKSLEKAMLENDKNIAPSMIYAYASLMEGVPFANGAPNLTVDIPAMLELAREREVPICGKDFKTGQTLIKTVLAPAFKARLLGLSGWYSTNILGNRDARCWTIPDLSRPRKNQSSEHLSIFCSRRYIPSFTATCTTKSASTITRRAAITKKAGTTSISSDGSAIRCRSKWTSCAAIRFWPRQSCLISCSSSI